MFYKKINIRRTFSTFIVSVKLSTLSLFQRLDLRIYLRKTRNFLAVTKKKIKLKVLVRPEKYDTLELLYISLGSALLHFL